MPQLMSSIHLKMATGALIAADTFIESCTVKTEFFVGQGAQRGQPAFSADDNISPMLWNFTAAQLTAKLKAFRLAGQHVSSVTGLKAKLVQQVKACMLAAPAHAVVPAPAPGPAVVPASAIALDSGAASHDGDGEDSDWEDNAPNVADDALDKVIARGGEGVDDPVDLEDEDFDAAMFDAWHAEEEEEADADGEDDGAV